MNNIYKTTVCLYSCEHNLGLKILGRDFVNSKFCVVPSTLLKGVSLNKLIFEQIFIGLYYCCSNSNSKVTVIVVVIVPLLSIPFKGLTPPARVFKLHPSPQPFIMA